MKVALIQPKMRMRPMDTTLKTRMAPSLGLLTVANVIREGNEIEILNENVEEINYSAISADIVGITVTVDTLPRAIEIASEFKKRGVPVVAGGIHITSCPESAEGYFNVLCIGFAEKTWKEIMEDLKRGELKARYSCIHLEPDEIVGPAYDMIDPSKYLYVNVISASRGCPFKCEFCYNSCTNIRNSYVNRRVADVVEDIRKIGKRHVMFIDDNFIGNPAWTREFLKTIKPMGLKWQAAVSANVVEIPGLLDEMKEAGCQGLFIGFESLCEDALKGVSKNQNSVKRYERLVKEIHDRGIMINASFVFGLDGDTPDTFRHTLDWIVRNKIETVTSHILTPYPGTKQHEDMLREGRIVNFDQRDYTTSEVVFKSASMSAEQLKSGYLKIYDDIYSWKNIFKRLPRHQKAGYLLFNILYRKYGKFTERICSAIGYSRIGKICENMACNFSKRTSLLTDKATEY
ncbi:MAG: B12-binding domain-containing radical SAM protein [Muribaculaceae bacterium]|nr:B12-binding domain-containing radical SAM protein [Muribaculaceae bacterium]